VPAFTLAIDVGGSGLKAAVLDEQGEMTTERVRVETPKPCPPALLVETVGTMVAQLPPFDRVSVGFPGVVRRGKILTAPNLDTELWNGFDLRSALAAKLGKPVRVKNDAALQGLGAIRGDGVECVITLGTGFGFSLFDDGFISPQLEMAHHPLRDDETYEEQLGKKAFKNVGTERWNKRLRRAINTLRNLTAFDRMFIGGGNAKHVDTTELPPDVQLVSNDLGMRGGIWLWRDKHESVGLTSTRET
jgi:polyphosphate glucokinase